MATISSITSRFMALLIIFCIIAFNLDICPNQTVSAAAYYPWSPKMGQRNHVNHNERIGELVSQLEQDLKGLSGLGLASRTGELPSTRRSPPVDEADSSKQPPTASTRARQDSQSLARLAEDIFAEVLDQQSARMHSARPGPSGQQRRFVDFSLSPTTTTAATTTTTSSKASNRLSMSNNYYQQAAEGPAYYGQQQQQPLAHWVDCRLKSDMVVGTSGYRLPCRDTRLVPDASRRYIKSPSVWTGQTKPTNQLTGGGDHPNQINSQFERMLDQLISSARPSSVATNKGQARPSMNAIQQTPNWS